MLSRKRALPFSRHKNGEKSMELFFFIFLLIVAAAAYLVDSIQPNINYRMIIFMCLFFLALNVFRDGIAIPNTGATLSGSTITFTSTTYTMNDTPILIAFFWLPFIMGIFQYVNVIELLLYKKVQPDGRIK